MLTSSSSSRSNVSLWRNVFVSYIVFASMFLMRNFSRHVKLLPIVLEASSNDIVAGSLAAYKGTMKSPEQKVGTFPEQDGGNVQVEVKQTKETPGNNNAEYTKAKTGGTSIYDALQKQVTHLTNQLADVSVSFKAANESQSVIGNSNLSEEDGLVIAQWMKNYFGWHKKQLSFLNESRNLTEHRILVMRCLQIEDFCGGTADRLRPVPLALRLAHKYNRLLFIKWERPAPLEEFLHPPEGGLDWRMPEWLDKKVRFRRYPYIVKTQSMDRILRERKNMFMVDMRYQSADQGNTYYNENREENEPSYETVYSDVWRILFEPAPAVRSLIQQYTTNLGLNGVDYTSLHIRSMYQNNRAFHKPMLENAVHCAFALNRSTIFIASDNGNATRYAVEYAKQFGKAVARLDEKEPLHLDRGTQYLKAVGTQQENVTAKDFYDTWVDLYLMSGSSCISHGIGGFGWWTGLIGQAKKNNCKNAHSKRTCPRPDVLTTSR
jgi:hypothetical protein